MSVPNDLGRLESLGDNCELGFVLRRLGWEDGSLLRWASITPEQLLATLRGDFAELYEFDNLVPCRRNMVRDLRYGTAWHSEMRCRLEDGTWVFIDDEPRRRVIHAEESAKRAHLVAKLRRKFDHPNPVFVIKSNGGIADDVSEALHYQLYRRVGSSRFALLEICADEQRAGMLEVVDRHYLRGFVARFASYDDAAAADDQSWHAVLTQALSRAGKARPSAAAADKARFDAIVLPFPVDPEPQLEREMLGDVRGGVPRLLRGNEWCRLVEDDVYRLHAIETGPGATALSWTGLHLPPGCSLDLHAGWAIADSKPVRAGFWLAGANGRRISCGHVFGDARRARLSLDVPTGAAGPFSAWLVIEPVEPLPPGERAVLDLQPITAVRRADLRLAA